MPIARTRCPLQQQAPSTRISIFARRQDKRAWLRLGPVSVDSARGD